MNGDQQQKIKSAEAVIKDYGLLLAKIEPSVYGMPVSILPHDKDTIKDAIQLLLWELGSEAKELRDSLIQGYAFLAQFIPDNEADIVNRGQTALQSKDVAHQDLDNVEQATKIINNIKAEMETLLGDLRIFMTQ